MDNEIRVVSKTGAKKGTKDQRFDLIPVGPLTKLAELYNKGALKYSVFDDDGNLLEDGSNNWRKGFDWSLSYAALMRHITQFWNGEDIDEETGIPHPICAAFHAFALTYFIEHHREFDNRPKVAEPVVEKKLDNNDPANYVVGAYFKRVVNEYPVYIITARKFDSLTAVMFGGSRYYTVTYDEIKSGAYELVTQ